MYLKCIHPRRKDSTGGCSNEPMESWPGRSLSALTCVRGPPRCSSSKWMKASNMPSEFLDDVEQPAEEYADAEQAEPAERLTVVGLDASAGGIKALQAFFEEMPAETGMVFVVVMHLAPDWESGLAELLQAHAAIPVEQVTGRVRLTPRHLVRPRRDRGRAPTRAPHRAARRRRGAGAASARRLCRGGRLRRSRWPEGRRWQRRSPRFRRPRGCASSKANSKT